MCRYFIVPPILAPNFQWAIKSYNLLIFAFNSIMSTHWFLAKQPEQKKRQQLKVWLTTLKPLWRTSTRRRKTVNNNNKKSPTTNWKCSTIVKYTHECERERAAVQGQKWKVVETWGPIVVVIYYKYNTVYVPRLYRCVFDICTVVAVCSQTVRPRKSEREKTLRTCSLYNDILKWYVFAKLVRARW